MDIKKPNQLGGGAPPQAKPGTATLLCSCIDTYQDPLTRHWMMKVQLDGGKVISGVRFMYPGSRVGTGSRSSLPATGERGLITWPANARQSSVCYWLGAVDSYVHGPDTEHPDETLAAHPSGQAEIKDRLGNQVWRYPSGDRVIQADTVHTPGAFYRPRSKEPKRTPWRFTHPEHSRKSEWFYDGAMGGELFGASLKNDQSKLWVRHGSYVMHTSILGSPLPFSSVIGTDKFSQLQAVAPGAEGCARVTPTTAQMVSSAGETAAVVLEGAGGIANLGSTNAINILTLNRLTSKANKIHSSAIAIQNDATVIYDGGQEPVAMGREVMVNFRAVQAALGLLGIPLQLVEVGSQCLHSTIGPGAAGSGAAYGPATGTVVPFESPHQEEKS